MGEREKKHLRAYKKIQDLLGACGFSFRIFNKNGGLIHIFRLTDHTAKRLGLPPLIENEDPFEVYRELEKAFNA
jgi:hypothetical protein